MSDEVLARETKNVDLIIGGHTHTFMDAPAVYKNRSGSDVIVNQVGWAGIMLGQLDLNLPATKRKNLAKSHTVVVGKKNNGIKIFFNILFDIRCRKDFIPLKKPEENHPAKTTELTILNSRI